MSPDLLAEDPVLLTAARTLATGGVVVVPTDTVYGVAASPEVDGATARLFALKQRTDRQPLAVLVADAEQGLALADLSGFAPGEVAAVDRMVARWWPGPLTLVLPRGRAGARFDLGGDPATIGVRCPASPQVRAIAARVGPLATTSANRHGEPTPATAAEAAASLAGAVDVVVDGGRCDEPASTVVDLTVHPWRVLRQGRVTADDLGLSVPASEGAGGAGGSAGPSADGPAEEQR